MTYFSLQRKRVSFADPPVSKEMGYEIPTTESSQKVKYPSSRNSMLRKDSPSSIRFKQTKLKLVPFDTEKLIVEDNTQNENGTESAVEVEKKNESLTKISEAYSEAMDIDEQIPSGSLENSNTIENIETSSYTKIDIIDELELAQEIEITTDSVVPENQQSPDDSSPIDVGTEDSETQQDIFDGTDAKTHVTVVQTNNDDMIKNNSEDSIKLNVTNDSVIAALSTKDDNPTNLEDTVDIQNITGLNSTVNTDEIVCEKPICSSSHATHNIAEQDTLTVTDSVFGSLSTTQGTQNQEAPTNAELDPEFLDSTQSIYPTLSSCVEPIDSITEQLTYPLWQHSLSMYFAKRNIHTIGDLAQLSEREINRVPIKGKPKTEFVKKVLERFETRMQQTEISDKKSNEAEQLATKATDEMPTVPFAAISDVEMRSAQIDRESLICSTPVIQSTEKISDNLLRRDSSIEDTDKTQSVTSDMDISLEPTIPGNSDMSTLDTSKKDEQTSVKVPIAAEILKPGTFTDNAEPVPIPSSSSESRYVIFNILIL